MIYSFRDFTLDDRLYQLCRAGEIVEIEPKIFDLLAYLILHRDHSVTRDELMAQLWADQVISETTLTHCVAKVRKAVQDDGVRQHVIKTQHGRGYRFIADVHEYAREDQQKTVPEASSLLPLRLPLERFQQPVSLTALAPVTDAMWAPSLRSSSSSPQKGAPGGVPHGEQEHAGGQSDVWVLATENSAAMDVLLRGWDYFLRYTPETNIQARQLLQQAVELDPHYALAYTCLGATYYIEWCLFWSLDPSSLDTAFSLAQEALASDPTFPYSYTLQAGVYLMQRRYAEAIATAQRAIARDPTCAHCYGTLADVLIHTGQPGEALPLVKKAMQLEPLQASYLAAILGHAYRLLGRNEEAILAFKRTVNRNPNVVLARSQLVAVYSELGRKEEARAELEEVLRIVPHASLEVVRQVVPYKDYAEVERLLTAFRQAGLE